MKAYPESVKAETRRLYVPGVVGHKQVARQLNVPSATVYRWVNDGFAERQRAAARSRKERYRGTCGGCGSATTGSDGPTAAPRFCATCWPSSPEGQAVTAAQTKWTRELIIDRICEWAALYGEPPAMSDWNPWEARNNHDEARARRWEDAAGHWPWMTRVVARFGTWNNATTAAGFQPRATVGTSESSRRRRPRQHRTDAA